MTPTERDGGQLIRAALPAVAARLPGFLPAQRWFGGKERAVERVEIRDTAVIPDHPSALLAVIDVFTAGEPAPAAYFLPLGLADADLADSPGAVVATVGGAVVRDAIGDPDTCRALLRGIVDGRTLPTALGGRFVSQPVRRQAAAGRRSLADLETDTIAVRHAGVEQSNSSVIFGDVLILKALRRLAAGLNPEIESLRFLGEHTAFDRVPALVGWSEYRPPAGPSAPVGVLQQFIPNQGDGWTYVLRRVAADLPAASAALPTALADLGRTLAGLHLALASRPDVQEFAPEPIGHADVAQWRRRTRASLEESLGRVERGLRTGRDGSGWSARNRAYGEVIRAGRERLGAAIDGINALADGRVVKTRHHGDFHLGQTLVAPDGWVIIDFEGEPLRSLAERRAKQTPLRDLAGLLRSLDYARATAAREAASAATACSPSGVADASSAPAPNPAPQRAGGALDDLFERCRAALLAAYVETVRAGEAPIVPARPDDLTRALLALEVEKALYELGYELGNRPDWVSIPLAALARLARPS
jgi:trehalose synthase-fused probable maltokinase